MSNITNKFMNRMFRRIGGLVWDVTSGGIGLKTENGIYSLKAVPVLAAPAVEGAPAGVASVEYSVTVNPFDDFGLAIPAFATQSSFEEVNSGDIIVGDQGIIGWVVGKTAAAFKVMDHNGYSKTYTPPSVQILGTQGVLVVRNLFSLTGGAGGAGNFANSLLPLMMLGGDDSKLEKMIPLLLMSSAAPAAGGNAGAANPMASLLPLMLLKDGGLGGSGGDKMDKLLPLMLMGGMGGGAGGMNPLMMMALMGDGDLFGGSTKKPVTLAPVTRGGVPTLNSGF